MYTHQKHFSFLLTWASACHGLWKPNKILCRIYDDTPNRFWFFLLFWKCISTEINWQICGASLKAWNTAIVFFSIGPQKSWVKLECMELLEKYFFYFYWTEINYYRNSSSVMFLLIFDYQKVLHPSQRIIAPFSQKH